MLPAGNNFNQGVLKPVIKVISNNRSAIIASNYIWLLLNWRGRKAKTSEGEKKRGEGGGRREVFSLSATRAENFGQFFVWNQEFWEGEGLWYSPELSFFYCFLLRLLFSLVSSSFRWVFGSIWSKKKKKL